MCLEVSVSVSALAKQGVGAERLARESGLNVAKTKNNLGSCLLFSMTGGCSCELLSEQADFESSVWALNEDALNKLAHAVALVGKEAKSFTFQARWLGDEIGPSRRVPLAALLKAIRSNEIPKNTPLVIGSNP